MSDGTTQTFDAAGQPDRGGLANVQLFSDVPSDALFALEDDCNWLKFEPNDVVLDRNDTSRDVYFIANGLVRVMNYIGDQREVTLANKKAGDHFGELAAIGPRERTARVIAIEKTVVGVMSRDKFLATLLEFPQVSLRLLNELAYIIASMNERVSTLSLTVPRQRVYLELLRLAVPDPRGGGAWVIEPLPTHNDIAGWAGVDEEEVAHAIGKLAREQVLERRNKTLIIHDRAKIRDVRNVVC